MNELIEIGDRRGCLTVLAIDKEAPKVIRMRFNELKGLLDQGPRFSRDVLYRIDQICEGKPPYICLEHLGKLSEETWYIIQCSKCGRVSRLPESFFTSKKRHIKCLNKECAANRRSSPEKRRQNWIDACKRVPCDGFNEDFSGRTFECLSIIEPIMDVEELTSYGDKRKKGSGTITIFRMWKCRCSVCGRESNVKASDFQISPPTAYGYNAYNGYWSKAKTCDCHKTSSFQWIVNKILFEHNVRYQVEYSFPDLVGVGGRRNLRYDFCIFDSTGQILCLIECQGEQHYKPVDEFGGTWQFELQKSNDERKKQFAESMGIAFHALSYKEKKYDLIFSKLCEWGVVTETVEYRNPEIPIVVSEAIPYQKCDYHDYPDRQY